MQCIHELENIYPNALLFIRGDANANPNDKSRSSLMLHLCQKWSLNQVRLHHKTYHHFVGNGNSDSEIDIILHTKESTTKKVLKIY